MTDPDNTAEVQSLDAFYMEYNKTESALILTEIHRLVNKRSQWEALFREQFGKEVVGIDTRIRLLRQIFSERRMFGLAQPTEGQGL